MGFQESFDKLKGSKWVVPTYIVLVILASIGLAYLNTCLATILIPVTMFAIPYYMGEKRPKYFVLLGVVVIIVDSFAFGLLDADFLSRYEVSEQVSPDGVNITQGLVSPTVGDAETLFTFTVMITDVNVTNTSAVEFYVYVNVSDSQQFKTSNDDPYDMFETDDRDRDATDGKNYSRTIQLSPGIHFFHFSANVNGTWHTTLKHDDLSNADFRALGPINADSLTLFQVFFVNAFVFMIFTSILFMIFVMMYWWIGKSRIDRT
ncbi:MAG: hypothetical protein ACE5IJ_08565, partial [Thermoplasmata archaeon]